MPTKQIDRLMFAQGSRCFFCDAPLPKSEASVEHLVASSREGSNSDDNCIACCKAVNGLFGSMSLKEKIRVVLNQNGKFLCPNSIGANAASAKSEPASRSAATPTNPKVDIYEVVLADLKKRGSSRPRKVDTLKSTIRATAKNNKDSLTDAQLEALLKRLNDNEKVVVDGTKVSYSL